MADSTISDRDARRSGGYGAPNAVTLSRCARVEWAFATIRGMLETACPEQERVRRIALFYASGMSDPEIAQAEGVDVRCVKDSLRHATAALAHHYPEAPAVLVSIPPADLLRAHRNKAESTSACWACGGEAGTDEDRRCVECGAEWVELERGESEQTTIRGRPFGGAPSDLRAPRDLSPADVARRWHRLLCSLRQVTMPERALARAAEVPGMARSEETDERRKTRRERRAERRKQPES